MTDIRVSVIVPAYNVERYLPRCINSLLEQNEDSLEIIIVNDGATDATGEIADNYANHHPEVRVIHQENGGLSAARNRGIDESKGKYVCFIDGDDWAERGWIRAMADQCDQVGAEVAITGMIVDVHDDEERLIARERRTPEDMLLVKGECIPVDITTDKLINMLGYAWNKLYLRSLLTGYNLRFEPGLKLVEDIEFNARALGSAARITFLSQPFIHYIQRPGLSLGKILGNDYLYLRLRAVNSVDALFQEWGVSEACRLRVKSRASGLTLWASIRASSKSTQPRKHLVALLQNPAYEEIMFYAVAFPCSGGWRGAWATSTLRRHWHAISLFPFRASLWLTRLLNKLQVYKNKGKSLKWLI